VIFLGACTAGRPTNQTDQGTDDAGRGDSTARGDAVIADGGGGGPCPPSLPTGGACKTEGLVCQYGADPRRECRPAATCTSGTWKISNPGCPEPPTATCPATRDEASGKICSTKDAYCSYPGDLICHCTNCIDHPVPVCQGDFTWRCDTPNPDDQCPPGKPNLGTACSVEGKHCVYGCGTDGGRKCSAGSWKSADGSPCPVSTRRVKRGIRYLAPRERERIAARLLGIKLATYRYTDPALGEGRQLGFILEDVGPSPAGDPSAGRVNLYGYASMLLATVQTQQRAIGKLEREVRALRATLRGR
jgi:hypothetical protein